MKFISFLHRIRPVINASEVGKMIGRPQSLLSMYTDGGRPMSERNQYACAVAIAEKLGAIEVGGKYFTNHAGKLWELVPMSQRPVTEIEFNNFCNAKEDRAFLSVFFNVDYPIKGSTTTFHVVGEIRNGEEFLFMAKDPDTDASPDQYKPVYITSLKGDLIQEVERAMQAAKNGEVAESYLYPQIAQIVEFWGKNQM